MKLKKRIIVVFLIIMILSSFIFNVKAIETEYPNPSEFIEKNGNVGYFIFKKYLTDEYFLYYYDSNELYKDPRFYIEDTEVGKKLYFSNNENWHRAFSAKVENGNWKYSGYFGGADWSPTTLGTGDILYSSIDIYSYVNKDYIYRKADKVYVAPSVVNEEEIVNWNFSHLIIKGNSVSAEEGFDIRLHYGTSEDINVNEGIYNWKNEMRLTLDKDSKYYDPMAGYYKIPKEDILPGIIFRQSDVFGVSSVYFEEGNMHLDTSIYIIGERKVEDIEDEKHSQTIGAITDLNNTNKGIWETIKDILSYINPFSENFFVYKLIELLIEALKSLFVPSDNFFTNWLDDLNTYFGEAFGILYYPFEMLIDFLNRISSISETSTAIISVPSFTLNFLGYSVKIFDNLSFDFNTILADATFKNMHDIYLIFTDIILWLCVIYLASKCIRNIIGGMGDEVQERVDESQASERSYEKYSQYRKNKERYNKEQK